MTGRASVPPGSVHWILRIACAGCFIGHGVFGVWTKVDWLPFYFAFQIPPYPAYFSMPIVGTLDILMGALVLVWPCPAVLIWMTVWGFFTACLRPLAGQAGWESLERAGNYGVPLAFLLLSGWFENGAALFGKIKNRPVSEPLMSFARVVLVWTTGLLLIGHGALLAIAQKDLFVYQFLQLGIHAAKEYLALAGVMEMTAGILVLFWQPSRLLMFILSWKLLTELLYPLSGFPVWEFVERAGSYAAPLALLFLSRAKIRVRPPSPELSASE